MVRRCQNCGKEKEVYKVYAQDDFCENCWPEVEKQIKMVEEEEKRQEEEKKAKKKKNSFKGNTIVGGFINFGTVTKKETKGWW